VLVLPELVVDDALEVGACGGRFCAGRAEAAAVEGEYGAADGHLWSMLAVRRM